MRIFLDARDLISLLEGRGPSDRPPGRRAYTCGHEIGHDRFEHGLRVDNAAERAGTRSDPSEYVADRFAAALLMPKVAVAAAFSRRSWPVASPTPAQAYMVAAELGVGYRTLVGCMQRTLGFLVAPYAKQLLRVPPKNIRAELLGRGLASHLVVVDCEWRRGTVDLEVGDVALVEGLVSVGGSCTKPKIRDDDYVEVVAVAPGRAVFGTTSVSGEVRVSPRAFKGLAGYRYLAEPEQITSDTENALEAH